MTQQENKMKNNNKFTLNLTILQHEIKIICPANISPDTNIISKLESDINTEILNFNDCGTVTFNQLEYDWEIAESSSYLKTQVKILENNEEVCFTYNTYIYEIFLNSQEEYEINIYASINDIRDDIINDGGCCNGSSRDAVYFMIGEE